MSGESETSSEVVSEEAASPDTTETTSESTSEYSVTDPGYDAIEPDEVEDELEALKAENTKQPSDEESSDDASETEVDGGTEDDSETEELADTPVDDDEGSADTTIPVDEISDELLDRAIAAGFELNDVKSADSAAALERQISLVERLQARKAGNAESEQTPPEAKEPDWDQMVEDGHDPDIIAMQKSSWQRAAAAEAEVRELRKAEQARAVAAESDRFDQALNELGDEYEPLLGKGRRSALMQSSPQAAENRQKVYTKMTVLRRGYELSGVPVPPESELIQEAVQASFYKQTQELARNSLKKQIRKSSSQALSRPRSGGATELSGADRALQKEQEFWKTHS